jgi:hypothetical protein
MMKEFVKLKLSTLLDDERFSSIARENFTTYYKLLVKWVKRMRKWYFLMVGRGI